MLVVDLSRALAGPHAGMMLGDLGARVIKVERPDGGDDARAWGPPFLTAPARDGRPEETVSTYFLSANRNKESITLDLKDAADRELLTELIRRADVLIENFRPGTLDRLGFDPGRLEELNPRLVLLSISGFGHDGPEADRAGYDQILQGEAGLMSLTGADAGSPQKAGVPIGDLLGGIHGVVGVLAALVERERTGRGKVVRTSLLSSLVGVLAFQATRWTVGGDSPHAIGNQHPSIAPYGAFRCADGVVQISVGSDPLWRTFAPLIGVDPEEERWATNGRRVADRDALIAHIEGVFAASTRAELLASLGAAGIPAGTVRTVDEVFEWDQARSQGLALGVHHEVLGDLTLQGGPLRMFDFDGTETGRVRHDAPPLLGEHTEAVREWLAV
ncbi:CoA transferase [Microbacterium capsulatum]|uniref:CoA transferase n=1 Tax=Microbacterium capsulatum TaxID=3041921 RepID=A0ABU0XER4_9MICO|nr:CoA transferase [Microbacterium sp. ASV81]MDQ4213609.1 CoA transferase [Microbacterium sp. ASV81]